MMLSHNHIQFNRRKFEFINKTTQFHETRSWFTVGTLTNHLNFSPSRNSLKKFKEIELQNNVT